ncbi:MAG: RluA family pseudouridine synthase [Patescibacteria group bacterium]
MGDSIKIIKNCDDYLVIVKPSGLIVHPNAHQKTSTLVDWLIEKYPIIKGVGENEMRPGIVHRLDQDVSGLMVVAKNSKSFYHLKKQFQDRLVKKEYYGLVFGKPDPDQGEITLSVGRSKTEPGKFKIKHDQTGKPCLTQYQVTKKFKKFALLDIILKTGRTHQIRVHLKGIGHSLVGDKLYKSKGGKTSLDRIFLHAYSLGFNDLNGQWQQFKIDLPPDLKSYLAKLE